MTPNNGIGIGNIGIRLERTTGEWEFGKREAGHFLQRPIWKGSRFHIDSIN